MPKEKSVKETAPKGEKEMTFTCRFCGETKPFSEMVIETRYFPLLTSCRECSSKLENMQPELEPEEEPETGTEEEPVDEDTGDVVEE